MTVCRKTLSLSMQLIGSVLIPFQNDKQYVEESKVFRYPSFKTGNFSF